MWLGARSAVPACRHVLTWLVSSVLLGSAQVVLTGRPPILQDPKWQHTGRHSQHKQPLLKLPCETDHQHACHPPECRQHPGCATARAHTQQGRSRVVRRLHEALPRLIRAGVVVEGDERKAAVQGGVLLVHHQLNQLHTCRREGTRSAGDRQRLPSVTACTLLSATAPPPR